MSTIAKSANVKKQEDRRLMDHPFKRKIASRTLRVAVIGLGYVGLPLATAFAKEGFHHRWQGDPGIHAMSEELPRPGHGAWGRPVARRGKLVWCASHTSPFSDLVCIPYGRPFLAKVLKVFYGSHILTTFYVADHDIALTAD